ncbi:MAG: Cys-tRNA(Pro) deacylase [Muribaculaceae bacterium]|nr:Cys-tRNA(Pro) deacylase [Muribaculaceae bacterium]
MAKKEKIAKTNATRLLEQTRVAHRVVTYEVDPDDLSAEHLAETAGLDIEVVYKTLVLHGEKVGHFVAVIPGGKEVDLKVAATAAGAKKAEMIPLKELLPTTGYIRGGCSPIGMKKQFPTFIDASAIGHDEIFVSAGMRGLQIGINPDSLASFVNATFVENLAREKK